MLGSKTCPACQTVNQSARKTCHKADCNHKFEFKNNKVLARTNPSIQKVLVPKGYKRCPKCSGLVRGPRTPHCECGYQFGPKKDKTYKNPIGTDGLTQRQREIRDFFRTWKNQNKFYPSYEIAARHFGVSRAAIHVQIQKLRDKDALDKKVSTVRLQAVPANLPAVDTNNDSTLDIEASTKIRWTSQIIQISKNPNDKNLLIQLLEDILTYK